MANKFNFDVVLKKLKQNESDLMLILANIAKNEFVGNFKDQGFDGRKWQEVKRRIPGQRAYAGNKDTGKRTRAILQGKGSGRLRKDVANSVLAGHSSGKLSYTLVVNNDYAAYHNNGTNKIPQRQFIGMTTKLNKKLLDKIQEKTKSIW